MPRRPRSSRTAALAPVRRVIGYVRVSTDKQADEGVSLEAQRAKLAAYAELYGYALVDVAEDAGRSGSTLDRPALAGALDRLARGEADALLVVKLDRLTRSVRDLAELLERSQAEGWGLLSVAEALDTGSAAGRMVVGLLGVVAQWEREATGERTAAAMAHMAIQGLYTGGGVPYGYRLALDGERLEQAPEEQAVIVAVRDYRAAGLSLRATAARLEAAGMLTRGGGRWYAEQIRMVECAR